MHEPTLIVLVAALIVLGFLNYGKVYLLRRPFIYRDTWGTSIIFLPFLAASLVGSLLSFIANPDPRRAMFFLFLFGCFAGFAALLNFVSPCTCRIKGPTQESFLNAMRRYARQTGYRLQVSPRGAWRLVSPAGPVILRADGEQGEIDVEARNSEEMREFLTRMREDFRRTPPEISDASRTQDRRLLLMGSAAGILLCWAFLHGWL